MRLPRIVAHADWSVDSAKRWSTQAILGANGRYSAAAPVPVGCPLDWLRALATTAGDDGVFLGFDFPIGLPRHYAVAAGVTNFIEFLLRLGRGHWHRFYDVAAVPDLSKPADLRRICDGRTVKRGPACPMFWTVGANQVGTAAIVGWRDLLVPALKDASLDIAVWPFHGPLDSLLEDHRIVVAETYPGECYSQLGLNFRTIETNRRGSKRRQSDRALHAKQLFDWTRRTNVYLSRVLTVEIGDGFGASRSGEDAFDATIGLFGMLNVLAARRAAGEPEVEVVRRIEGWILGLDRNDLLD